MDKVLWDRYADIQAQYEQFNSIENIPSVIIAYLNGEAVGCGSFKKFDKQTAEIKRVFVKPEHRGKGIAAALLADIECWMHESGFTKAVLETGDRLQEAIGLYRKKGYEVIENYGPYAEMEHSICMSKELAATANN
ncbi:GNAT family N-acetyltransferase [Pontibacter silvestris]|uniref:GNAT family N-acetyltransferase n=1 Tax=Pontibacter silvestris TaxID=2305183 RepID=UPI001E58F6C5|nr:GNAT family N-acetyltransferase [Pontibacter silvestris]MCC9134922.1 GNAT family N-acetyltransferase [Pontibacter silvestris]